MCLYLASPAPRATMPLGLARGRRVRVQHSPTSMKRTRETLWCVGVLGEDRQGSTIVDLTRAASHRTFAVIRPGLGLSKVLDVLGRYSLTQSA